VIRIDERGYCIMKGCTVSSKGVPMALSVRAVASDKQKPKRPIIGRECKRV
jgi:hypothetical protein